MDKVEMRGSPSASNFDIEPVSQSHVEAAR